MANLEGFTAPGVLRLHPYIPGKPVEELERELGIRNSLKLASNENPLGASPLAVASAKQAIDEVNLYPDDMAFRLKNKLAALHGVSFDSLIMGNGSSDVLDMVARTFLQPGVNAVFAEHSFAMYPIFTTACGAECKVAAVNPPEHQSMPYGADLQAMTDAVDENTRIVFIANPNNPTGTWVQAAELKAFIRALPESVIVVLDEAYIEYVTDPEFANGIEWLDEFPNLLVTRTFSKMYGLAGLRIGYGVANPALAGLINRLRHPFNANLLALVAAEAALDDQAFVSQSIANNTTGLKQLIAGFEAMDLSYIPSVGNFISVDVKANGNEIYQALLRKGVIVRPVANYNLPTHLRITVGQEDQNQRALTALAEVLAK